MRFVGAAIVLALAGALAAHALADTVPIPPLPTVSVTVPTVPVPVPTIPTLPTAPLPPPSAPAPAPQPSTPAPTPVASTTTNTAAPTPGTGTAGASSPAAGGKTDPGAPSGSSQSSGPGLQSGSSVSSRPWIGRNGSKSRHTTTLAVPRDQIRTSLSPTHPAAGPVPPSSSTHAGGALASSVEKTARAIRPLLIGLLAAAIVLLGLASVPGFAVPHARVNDLLARHRAELAGLGAVALISVVFTFLLG